MIAIKALLFDLDGTLVDSVDDLTVAANIALKAAGYPPVSREDMGRFIGKGARVLIERVLTSKLGRAPSSTELEPMLTRYLAEMNGAKDCYTKLLPGVREALSRLKAAGIPMAVVTNKPSQAARSLLNRFELTDFFDCIIGADDVKTPKPDPEMLQMAANIMRVNLKDCAMIGDSMNDALAAENAGIQALLVKTGYNEGIAIDLWVMQNKKSIPVFNTMTELADNVLKITTETTP